MKFTVNNKILGIIVTVAVIVAVGFGLWQMGTPKEARQRRADDLRASSLQQISSAVNYYYESQGELPVSLDDLVGKAGYLPTDLADPMTQQPYEYSLVDDQHYEICATFDTNTNTSSEAKYAPYYGLGNVNFYLHDAGQNCFTLSIPKSQV